MLKRSLFCFVFLFLILQRDEAGNGFGLLSKNSGIDGPQDGGWLFLSAFPVVDALLHILVNSKKQKTKKDIDTQPLFFNYGKETCFSFFCCFFFLYTKSEESCKGTHHAGQ